MSRFAETQMQGSQGLVFFALTLCVMLAIQVGSYGQRTGTIQRLNDKEYLLAGTELIRLKGSTDADRHLYLWNAQNGEEACIRTVAESGSICGVEVSCNGEIAIAEVQSVDCEPFERKRHIHVIDRMGRVLHTCRDEQDIWSFSWSPDGGSIIYFAGTPAHDWPGGYQNPNMKLFCPQTGETEEILAAGDGTFYWAPFDGCVYIRDFYRESGAQVCTYCPQTKKIAETELRDVFFSPGGTYYYESSDDLAPLMLYHTSDNVSVAGPIPSRILNKKGASPLRWLDGESLAFWIQWCPEPVVGTFILNVRTGEIRKVPGIALAWHTDDLLIIADTKDGKLQTIPRKELEIVKPEDLPLNYDEVREKEEAERQKSAEPGTAEESEEADGGKTSTGKPEEPGAPTAGHSASGE